MVWDVYISDGLKPTNWGKKREKSWRRVATTTTLPSKDSFTVG